MTAQSTPSPAETRARIAKMYRDVAAPCMSAAEFALIKSMIDFKAFDAIPETGDIAISEIATQVGGTEEVLVRITNFLVAREVLSSPSSGRVAHTPQSLLYRSDQPTAWLYIHMFNNALRSFAHLPAFFTKFGLSSPKSVRTTPLGLAHGEEDKPHYEILVDHKSEHKGFNEALGAVGDMYSLKGVYDFGWIREALAANQDRLAVVDIGGSHGKALRDIVRSNAYIPAERCAILDLPQVIENTRANVAKTEDELQRIGLVPGSMFEELPEQVRGACVFQVRRVFNDFPDEEVVKALTNIRKSLSPDSRLLIIEEMLNPKIPLNTGLDIFLMMGAGKRRNAEMFSKLAEPAGFKLNAEFSNVNAEFDDFGVLEFVPV